jgi:cyclopropane fatty-acyl-phospholipid synthase-like methyltransferase
MKSQSLPKKIEFFIKRKLLNRNFDSRKYWELRYQSEWNSGVGSYGENAEAKAKILNTLVEKYSIDKLIEFGCGDGNNLQFYKIPNYLGLDVSAKTISNCIERYKEDKSKSFMAYDPMVFHNLGNVIDVDATISLDVIFHLVEKDIFEKYMRDLFSLSKKYVFIFSSDHEDNDNSSIHVRHWKFTEFVKEKLPDWELLEVLECKTKSGQQLDNWYVYKNKSCL